MPADAPRSPYEGLPPGAYWRSGVSERTPLEPAGLYTPRFPIRRRDRIVTAGSCFAQHVGRTLTGAGFNVVDAEPLPGVVADDVARRFGYRLFSGRYGNIYTVRQLQQLLEEMEGEVSPALPVWEREGRYFDSQRPNVEPEGLDSPEEVAEHRELHLAALRELFRNIDVFVFTFGLTEAWVHTESGTVYPTAPGTIAGSYDPEVFSFVNADAHEVFSRFRAVRQRLMGWNPKMRFLVTVSPVPLTATASGQHVEVATAYSKAVLRAAAGRLYERFKNIDYFPSYEIITSQTARGTFYEPNLRSVSPIGVQTAMNTFLHAQGIGPGKPTAARPGKAAKASAARAAAAAEADEDEVVCEEALLEAFAK